MTKLYVLFLRPVNLKSLVMLKRFIKLCVIVAIALLVPYYTAILVFGAEAGPPEVWQVWFVGVIMLIILAICITVICMMVDYVVNGR
jgi:heme/copper-type cytochrome/quinol oxidase subunit 2